MALPEYSTDALKKISVEAIEKLDSLKGGRDHNAAVPVLKTLLDCAGTESFAPLLTRHDNLAPATVSEEVESGIYKSLLRALGHEPYARTNGKTSSSNIAR